MPDILSTSGGLYKGVMKGDTIGVQNIVYVHPQGSHGCSFGLGGYCVGFTG